MYERASEQTEHGVSIDQTGIKYLHDYGDDTPASVQIVPPRTGCAEIDREIAHRYNTHPDLLEAHRDIVKDADTADKAVAAEGSAAFVEGYRQGLGQAAMHAQAAIEKATQ